MPYPTEFPYDLLDATPADDANTLRLRWGQATIKRRERSAEVRTAFDELRNPRTRLGYDILLVTEAMTPLDVSALSAQIAEPKYFDGAPETPPITLALTDLVGDHQPFYGDVAVVETPVTGSDRFGKMLPELGDAPFDK